MNHLGWAAELPTQWEAKPLRSTTDYVVSNVDNVPAENECPVQLCNYRYSKGVWSSRLRLYPEGFFEVFSPVPPLHEQREIVSHVTREVGKLDALRVSTERTIDLIKERRAALIAAAVTGQIDVGAAA